MPFRPSTPVEDMIVAVTHPGHRRFGQFGTLRFHDWSEYGVYGVGFPDGEEEMPDGLMKGEMHYATLLQRPVEIVDPTHSRHSQYGRCAQRIWREDAFLLWVEFEEGVQALFREEQIRRVDPAEMPELVLRHQWLGSPPGGGDHKDPSISEQTLLLREEGPGDTLDDEGI